jgi:Flp pilus assembly protein TadG
MKGQIMLKAALRRLSGQTNEQAGGRTGGARRLAGSDQPGQAIVILALTFVGIAVVVGLMTDMAIAIIAQAHLRRGVDAAAIAAATQVREGVNFQKIGQFASEYIRLNIDPNNTNVNEVIVQRCVSGSTSAVERYTYTATGAGAYTEQLVSPYVPTLPAEIVTVARLCEGNDTLPRKQIYVEGQVDVQFTFLRLINWNSATLFANATSEAAAVDLVLVFNTNELMAQFTPPLRADGYSNSYGPAFNPSVNPNCNVYAGSQFTKNPEIGTDKCRPFWDAKQAAKRLIDTLYEGVDRVAVVGYDYQAALALPLSLSLGQRATTTTDSTGVFAAIDSLTLKDEAHPFNYGIGASELFNPMNLNCRSTAPAGCTGPSYANSGVSGCAGCAIRVAANVLKAQGRPEALWVIVFLSDGYVNVSDVPSTPGSGVDVSFPNGFCSGSLASAGTWLSQCNQPGWDLNGNGVIDATPVISPTLPTVFGIPYGTLPLNERILRDPKLRFCGPYHDAQANCPPEAIFVGPSGIAASLTPAPTVLGPNYYYDTVDYARDMIDAAALTTNCATANCAPSGAYPWPVGRDLYNQSERLRGATGVNRSEILIYAIGFGRSVVVPPAIGETLLRYMAAVGDDGDRTTDPCRSTPTMTNCGNYYFAPDAGSLQPVFEDISRRIFTRLTR